MMTEIIQWTEQDIAIKEHCGDNSAHWARDRVVLQQACGGRNHGPAWCYCVMSTLHTLPTDYRLPATRHRLVVTLQAIVDKLESGPPSPRATAGEIQARPT